MIVSESVLQWRYERLLALGFTRLYAETIAWETQMDIHELERLIRKGSTPEVAARIVAPLDANL